MDSNDKKIIKICVSSDKESLDSEIDPRFGRCKNFLIVNIAGQEILDFKAIKNTGATQDSGAGINAAEQIGQLDVKALITGDVGPKASQVLEQLGIKVIKKSGPVKTAINEYINNTATNTNEANLPKDAGTKKSVEKMSGQRIFVPLLDDNGEDSKISLHFGHAPYFGLYNSANGELTIKKNMLDHSDLSKSPVDQVIEAVDPSVVFAQDMGGRAVNLFSDKNILLKTGPYKTVGEMINNIAKLEDLTSDCGH